jgi:hypothetical protein
MEWRDSVVRDLGGPDAISAQQATLVDLAMRTKLLVDHLDCFISEQESVINKNKRSAYPIVLQRQTLADALARYMQQLGVRRVPRPVPTLAEYVQQSKPEAANDERPASNG